MSNPSSDATVPLPERFGRYRIVRPLGQGGMGAVYLARDTRLDRDVALKVCTLAEKPKALERFRHEAKAAAALRHPNLCPIYDYDVHEGIAFITMAFIDGQSLSKWVAANPLDARGAAVLIWRLALAMQAAHDGGIIHRDLKPGNIAMDKKGEPIILDFGLARLADSRTHQTQQGAVFGTPTHMAPEQAMGDPDAIGPATDVYALGVIFYELLTGELPFEGAPMVVLAQVMAATPRSPRKLNPTVPVALETICLKALAKKPADRFASMKALADALAGAVRALPAAVGKKKPPPGVPKVGAVSRAAPMNVKTQATEADVFRQMTAPALPSTLRTVPRRRRRSSWRTVGLLLILVIGLTAAMWLGVRAFRKDSHAEPMEKPVAQVEPKKAPVAPQPDPIKPPDPVRPKNPRTNSLDMTFVHLPKGTFYMGWDGAKKGTKTEIKDDFEIAVYTVTQEQWAALMEGVDRYPSKFRRGGANAKEVEKISDEELKRFPVENVSWDMVQDYIKRLNEREKGNGWVYRLPTEAEWEYACRGGATSEADCSYHFYLDKPTNDLSSEQANFNGTLPFGDALKGKSLRRPTMVGSYPPNRLGLYDMHGNVWQWCSDLEGASVRVYRGGSWRDDAGLCRAAYRSRITPVVRGADLGFRLARVLSDVKKPNVQPPEAVRPKDERTNSLDMTFVHLPKGTFYMGWDGADKPGKKTEIKDDFEIAIHTVTQGQWQALMNDNPNKFRRDGEKAKEVEKIADEELKRFPVENVSWDMVQDYLKKLNEREKGSGWTYRLPTEAEWEYACRGGATSEADCSYHFYFDKPTNDLSSEQANFNGTHPFGDALKGKYLRRPTMVGSYPPNRLGLYDMHGNVGQWCSDLEGASFRVGRGGCWFLDAGDCRAAYRFRLSPDFRNGYLGFRLARVPSGVKKPNVQPPEAVRPKDERTNSLDMTFVHLPKGTFYMGWDGVKKGTKTEIKDDFEIAIHTVTQGQWAALMEGANKYPSVFSRGGANAKDVANILDEELKRLPVESVSWDMVQDYLKKLNERERGMGWTYRLPTEAEWEYACRGGATSEEECSHHFYFDKPTDDLSSDQANFNGRFPYGMGVKGKFWGRPVAVDSPLYKPNKLGLTHMHGNVCQLCSDLFEPGASERVRRGGGYGSISKNCRAADRLSYTPEYRGNNIGFRLVRVPSDVKKPDVQPPEAVRPKDERTNSLGMTFVGAAAGLQSRPPNRFAWTGSPRRKRLRSSARSAAVA